MTMQEDIDRSTCLWILTKEHTYHTECNHIQGFPQGDGDLEGSDFVFCPYCGKRIDQI